MKPLRVILCGSRYWQARGPILDRLRLLPPGSTIVHGACLTGADALADRVARKMGLVVEPHPADWDRYGRAAGPIRNAHMVSLGADLGLAFGPLLRADGKGSGTGDCVAKMKLAGIPVEHFGAEQAS